MVRLYRVELIILLWLLRRLLNYDQEEDGLSFYYATPISDLHHRTGLDCRRLCPQEVDVSRVCESVPKSLKHQHRMPGAVDWAQGIGYHRDIFRCLTK